MPKRNIVWIAIGTLVAVLLWQVPQNILRRDSLYNQFGPLLDVRVNIRKRYVEEVNDETLLRGAIDGMLHELDPYSEYYPPEEAEILATRTEGQYQGIGIHVEQTASGELLIVSPIEGSPAFQAGLRSGDLILKVGDVETPDISLQRAIDLIKGEPGTRVKLTILRFGEEEPMDISVARAVVTVRSVRGWARTGEWEWDYIIDPETPIGYVRLSSFERHTPEQFDDILRMLMTEHHIRGLIIDVRDNPGGLLKQAVDIIEQFIPGGLVVSTQGRSTGKEDYFAEGGQIDPKLKLAVLTNRGSASASEILAGTLRDYQRATLIGERTFGKGSVQEVFPVETESGQNGQLKLTTSYYYLPKGERIHGKGIEPEIQVSLTRAERDQRIESMLGVYIGRAKTNHTQPATGPAPFTDRYEVWIDPQLQRAIDVLKQQVATQPAN